MYIIPLVPLCHMFCNEDAGHWGGGFFGGGSIGFGAKFGGALNATGAFQSLQSAAVPWKYIGEAKVWGLGFDCIQELDGSWITQANVLGISTLITLNESWSWIPWYFSITSAFDILWWFCHFNACCITKRGKTLPHFDASTFSLPRRACRVCVRRWKGHSMKLWQIGVMRHWAAGKA